jgi:hypothetical protein
MSAEIRRLLDDKLQRLYNLVANLAHPKGGHRVNEAEDEAHDIIRELRQGVMGERALCATCHGNGVVKIPGGTSVCPACVGECWQSALLTTAPAAPHEERGWQPIETAPKGHDALLYNGESIRLDDWGDYFVHNAPGYTHWMPLPSPPVVREEETTK